MYEIAPVLERIFSKVGTISYKSIFFQLSNKSRYLTNNKGL